MKVIVRVARRQWQEIEFVLEEPMGVTIKQIHEAARLDIDDEKWQAGGSTIESVLISPG